MLSALDEKGRLVSLLDEISEKQTFTCPACHSPVRLRHGQIMRPHFAHVSLKNCDFYSENESDEHLQLKAALYQALSQSENVTVEAVLPELHQVADVLVNDNLALEVQCSRLSEKGLRERTTSYHKAGFNVLWLLGEKLWLGERLTPLQRHFLYFSQNMGFHLWELDAKQRLVRLHYLIYEDWHGKVHYLTKSCSLSGNLMAFFRLPYQKQKLSTYDVNQDSNLLSYIQRQLSSRNTSWLKRQEKAYLQGKNLLTLPLSAYFPQVRPPEVKDGFCQISQDLSDFYETFRRYYQNQSEKGVQRLYPPAYYGRMVNNAKKRRT
ncbi:competence protein CoiA [Streptococcus lutetiensis]|uniref:competence protein CoiA n=1 Tax=Streptococcus lutetiensis TaxID=150055 RepID=UPI001BDB1BB6|nr:competence protein CoiA family protein [Streptococcus lutetiensis]MBT0888806.1 competence protein CoiA [Streptococcus lutetiensis]MBT0913706.1 competence protein CoiA [Streptococcus lutetiensis]MBT0915396.1 competence protein CoiA [Streptococcus lutetiensis]MBT0918811.1 competence protein CoiA [Streptococcus lutetiensis]MBT0920498.1 competence protein CoiA [Streptococcus lutetiensis]